MKSEANDNQMNEPGPEAREMEAALDRLGQAERMAAPAGFEERMAATTAFTLLAGVNKRESGPMVVRVRFVSRMAAVIAVAALGVVGWRLMNAVPSGTAPIGLKPTNIAEAESVGDDSEVFSLVALALDGGTGSEIDFLLRDASELDGKIGSTLEADSSGTDEPLEGSTM
jgi:hypothetical protein